MTKNIKSVLFSGFVYTCTVNWFYVTIERAKEDPVLDNTRLVITQGLE